MSISVWAIRLIGLVVAVVGLFVFLSAFGMETGAHIPAVWWIEAIVGLLLIGAGVWIIRGGTITV